MTATAAQVTRLRRMAAELTADTYDDATLTERIEAHPLLDSEGREPADADWVPTYDLHAAAADVWDEKAAACAAAFDFEADGSRYERSQQHQMMMQQARYHRSRRSPTTGTLVKWPSEGRSSRFPWIANLPEQD